jgi:membrane-bound lytic murein transglycosylase A
MLAAGLAMAGCAAEVVEVVEPPPEAALFSPVSFESLPGWREDRVSEALPALLRSCRRLAGVADDRPVGRQGVGGSAADWREACRDLESLSQSDDAALRASLKAHFAPFEVSNDGDPLGLFTGYYEAELNGAMVPDEEFRWPLYRRPRDLVSVDLAQFGADLEGVRIVGRVEEGRLVPYRTRAEIDDGALAGQDLEIFWVDPVDAFFLHVQGSGRVVLRDDTVVRLGFAASNGLPFTAIGRILLDEGKVPRDQASMQGIRDWLRAHPSPATGRSAPRAWR